jgi:hypothetical protein
MVQPSLISPQAGSTSASLQPQFEWAYPGYYISNGPYDVGKVRCATAAFHISLSTGPSFQDELGTSVAGVPGFDTLYTRTWMPAAPLQPGRMYRWKIRPFSQGVEGPVSELRYFFTGPHCDPAALVSPTLLAPLNDWTVNDLENLSLTWWYPGACLPDGYDVEISTSLVFDGSPLNGSMNNPSTLWGPLQTLDDCTRYYWRVRPFRQNQPGPYSMAYTFRVDLSGSCAPETHGLIQGTVWEDQCAGVGPGTPVPEPLPLGCVLKNGDQIFTNQTYDPGEPGIPGLIVNLGQGACPSTGYRQVETGPDGIFNFYEILPGDYCASVVPNYSTNYPILAPGIWTFPANAVGQPKASQPVTIGAGQSVKNVNFGWWYQYGNPWGSTNASVVGNVWNDLCDYHAGDPIPDPLPLGCLLQGGVVHADGIHALNEPGIPGLSVKLGAGTCPASGMGATYTDAGGYYHFNNLPPGPYCIRIELQSDPTNAAILLPGHWTVVAGLPNGETYRNIPLTAGATLTGQNFAWQFDNPPAGPTQQATLPLIPLPTLAVIPPQFTLTMNANCRVGPDKRYNAVASFPAGQTFPLDGRSAESLWYFVTLNGSEHCWFAASVGSTSGDLSSLNVFYGPPLPTDTPKPTQTPLPACSAYKDQKSCNLHPACIWAFTTSGPGTCKSK